MNLKHEQNMNDANADVDLVDENVAQINGGIPIKINVIGRNAMYVKKIMFGILLHIVLKRKTFSKYYGWFNNYMW